MQERSALAVHSHPLVFVVCKCASCWQHTVEFSLSSCFIKKIPAYYAGALQSAVWKTECQW